LRDPEFGEFSNVSDSFVFINAEMKNAMTFRFQLDSVDFDPKDPKKGKQKIKNISSETGQETIWKKSANQEMILTKDSLRSSKIASFASIWVQHRIILAYLLIFIKTRMQSLKI